jgi:hypothetical protein
LGTLTAVILNTANESRDVTVGVSGGAAPNGEYEMFVSDAGTRCESQGMVSSGAWVTLPARSIVTLQAGGTPL